MAPDLLVHQRIHLGGITLLFLILSVGGQSCPNLCCVDSRCVDKYMERPRGSPFVEHWPRFTAPDCCDECSKNAHCESYLFQNASKTCSLFSHAILDYIFNTESCAGIKYHDPISSTTERGTCRNEDEWLAPYPGNCSKFFRCLYGDLTVDDCQNTQQFDCRNLRCQNPPVTCHTDGMCPEGNSTTPVTSPTTMASTPTGTTNLTTMITSTGPPGTTPSCGADEEKLTPHPVNCNQYISCFYGDQTTESCPPNQEFDCVNLRCQTPPVRCNGVDSCAATTTAGGGGLWNSMQKAFVGWF